MCFIQDEEDKSNSTNNANDEDGGVLISKLITASSDGTLNVYCLATSQVQNT